MAAQKPKRRPRLSWFPFFPDDWLGGTATLSDTESGLYLRCLAAQWASAERTAIPADPERLRLICRGADPGPAVTSKFTRVEIGGVQYLRNEKLAALWYEARTEYESRRRGAERTAERTAERDAEQGADRPLTTTTEERTTTPPKSPPGGRDLALAIPSAQHTGEDAAEADEGTLGSSHLQTRPGLSRSEIGRVVDRLAAFASQGLGYRYNRADRRDLADRLRGGQTEEQIRAGLTKLIAECRGGGP